MNNITYGKNLMKQRKTEKVKSTELITPMVEPVKIDVTKLITKCDELFNSISETYELRQFKDLNDAMITLSLVKKSLKNISFN